MTRPAVKSIPTLAVTPVIRPPVEPTREIKARIADIEVITIDPPLQEAVEQRIAARNQEIRILSVRSLASDSDSGAETVIVTTNSDDRQEIEVVLVD